MAIVANNESTNFILSLFLIPRRFKPNASLQRDVTNLLDYSNPVYILRAEYSLVKMPWGLLPGLLRTPYRRNTKNSATQPVGRVRNRHNCIAMMHQILTSGTNSFGGDQELGTRNTKIIRSDQIWIRILV